MNYYLVDFENVKLDGIKNLSGIGKGDAIIFFYSENCKNITIEVMENIANLNLQFKSFKAKTGTKNALDFQLSSYVGYLIGKMKKDDKYYIVSNDKGYDCVCDFWGEHGAVIERIPPQEALKAKAGAKSGAGTKTSAAKSKAEAKTKNKSEAGGCADAEISGKARGCADAESKGKAGGCAEAGSSSQAGGYAEAESSGKAGAYAEAESSGRAEAYAEAELKADADGGYSETEVKISERKKSSKRKVDNSNLATLDEIKKYLSEEDMPETVLAIFNQYKSKQAINNGISKECKDSKRTSAIYKKLKPLLKEKKKS